MDLGSILIIYVMDQISVNNSYEGPRVHLSVKDLGYI